LICENRHLERVKQALLLGFADHGFRLKLESVAHSMEGIKFCQTQPVCVNGVWRMCRDPFVVLSKDSTITEPHPHPTYVSEWANSVSKGGIAIASGIPVLQEFYRAMSMHHHPGLRNNKALRDFKTTGLYWDSLGMKSNYEPIHTTTRVSFFNAFGVTPDKQLVIEDYFRSLAKGQSDVFNNPLLLLVDQAIN